MISQVRATAIVSAGTLVTLGASVIAAKALALLIGPDGVGRLGITQSLLNITGFVVGLGVATGVVRALAAAHARDDRSEEAALRIASELLVVGLGAAGLVVLSIFRGPIAHVFLGSASRSGDVMFVGLAMVATLGSGVELAIVNGYHRLQSLTLATVVIAVSSQAVLIGFVLVWGPPAIAPALFVAGSLGLLIAVAARLKAVGSVSGRPGRDRVRMAGLGLLRFGFPYAASALVGAGAQAAVPVLVLNQLGQDAVGLYRAAATISVGYLAFSLTALAQDYYPRLAAAREEDLLTLIEQRMRIVMALMIPVILAILALAPLVIRILYTGAFLPATAVLDWQLAGDLLKLPGWTMAFVILARGGTGWYFLVELIGGGTLVAGTWCATSLFGLPGAGVAYFSSYLVYYAVVLLVVRRFAPATPGRLQLGTVGLVGVILVILGLADNAGPLRAVVFLALAAALALMAWPRLWRLHRENAV